MSPRCRFAPNRSKRVSLCAEPFRLFFPVGALASVIGVSLWPMVYAGWLDFFPGEAHARLMIEGFVGSFAIGFLGTAFPKMLGSPPFTWQELVVLLLSLCGCIASHALGLTAAGDAWFLLVLVFMLGCLAARLCFLRDDLPPPGFVLAGMGFLAGIVGVVILLVGRIILLSEFQRNLGQLLLYEAFILGPILGVGGFLFPRFFDDGGTGKKRPWAHRASLALVVGGLLLATYIVQAAGYAGWPAVLRSLVVAGYLLGQVRVFHRARLTGTLSFLLRAAVFCLLLGILVSDLYPPAGAAVRHVLFIGGYGVLILVIASRVTWGHSGMIHLAEGRRRPLQIIFWVVAVALATRVVAGFIPTIRVSHHIYAALLWIVAVGVWSWAVLRYVRAADPEDG